MTRGSDPVFLSHDTAVEVLRTTRQSQQNDRSLIVERRRGGRAGAAEPVEGRVTDSEVKSGAGFTTVWKYSFEQTTQSEPGAGNLAALSGGITGTLTAYNRWEEINPDAAADTNPIGMGAFPDDLSDGVTSTLGPVPNGTPAQFHPIVCGDGSLIYKFTGPNTLTMSCGEA